MPCRLRFTQEKGGWNSRRRSFRNSRRCSVPWVSAPVRSADERFAREFHRSLPAGAVLVDMKAAERKRTDQSGPLPMSDGVGERRRGAPVCGGTTAAATRGPGALALVSLGAWSTSRPAERSISHSRSIGSPSNAVGSSPRMHSKSAHPRRSALKPPAQSNARSSDTYASMSLAVSDRNFTANGHDIAPDSAARGVQHRNPGAEFKPSPAGRRKLSDVVRVAARFAEHHVVEQSDSGRIRSPVRFRPVRQPHGPSARTSD